GRGTRGAVYRIRYPRGFKADAVRAGPLPIQLRCLDWKPRLARELPRQAQGRDGLERRNALALIRRHHTHFAEAGLRQVVRANWDHPDRLIRLAAIDLIQVLGATDRRRLTGQAKSAVQLVTCGLAGASPEVSEIMVRAAGVLGDTSLAPTVRLDAVRMVQLALGDLMAPSVQGTVWEG